MPKIAVVTGASSGIGRAIANKIAGLGYDVYGIGRHFDDADGEKDGDDAFKEDSKIHMRETDKVDGTAIEDKFRQIKLDLMDTDLLVRKVKDIGKKGDITVLINCAGAAYYGLMDDMNTSRIQEMVRVNLEVPMILTGLLIRDLKKNKGYVINISSVTALSSNPHGVVYGATKAGLTGFSRSLFDESRKYGLKVCDIRPDMTQSNLYRNADFAADDDLNASLLPEDIADAVYQVLTARDGMVVNELTLRPQLHRIRKL